MSQFFGEAKLGTDVVLVSCAGLGVASAPFGGSSLKLCGCGNRPAANPRPSHKLC